MTPSIAAAAATSQIRLDTDGRAYYQRKGAEGKKPLEAVRCLKRRISDAMYRQLLADANSDAGRGPEASPGGHCGATQESSAVDLPPHIDTSVQPLPGPAEKTLRRTGRQQKGAEKTHEDQEHWRAGDRASNVDRGSETMHLEVADHPSGVNLRAGLGIDPIEHGDIQDASLCRRAPRSPTKLSGKPNRPSAPFATRAHQPTGRSPPASTGAVIAGLGS